MANQNSSEQKTKKQEKPEMVKLLERAWDIAEEGTTYSDQEVKKILKALLVMKIVTDDYIRKLHTIITKRLSQANEDIASLINQSTHGFESLVFDLTENPNSVALSIEQANKIIEARVASRKERKD